MILSVELLTAQGAMYKEVPASEVIFTEGAHCAFYHQLVSGSLKLVNINEKGKEFIQNICEPGDCFGEYSLFTGKPHAQTAVAISDVKILRLHKPVLLQMLRENPDVHFAFSRLLAENNRYRIMLLKILCCETPYKTLQLLLRYFKKENKNMCPSCHQLMLTRKQLAEMTGLRIETVIRTIRNLHNDGQVVINKGKIYC